MPSNRQWFVSALYFYTRFSHKIHTTIDSRKLSPLLNDFWLFRGQESVSQQPPCAVVLSVYVCWRWCCLWAPPVSTYPFRCITIQFLREERSAVLPCCACSRLCAFPCQDRFEPAIYGQPFGVTILICLVIFRLPSFYCIQYLSNCETLSVLALHQSVTRPLDFYCFDTSRTSLWECRFSTPHGSCVVEPIHTMILTPPCGRYCCLILTPAAPLRTNRVSTS